MKTFTIFSIVEHHLSIVGKVRERFLTLFMLHSTLLSCQVALESL